MKQYPTHNFPFRYPLTEPNYAALSLTEKNIYGKLTLPFGNVILPCYFPS